MGFFELDPPLEEASNDGSSLTGIKLIVSSIVRNLVVENSHWKLQNVVNETNMEETTNDQKKIPRSLKTNYWNP